ncbi:hypothetical protein D3C71_743290 [compost metagenome]
MGFANAVIVLGPEADFQCAIDRAFRLAFESDFRRAIGNDVECPVLAVDGQITAFIDCHGIGARRERLGAVCRGCGRLRRGLGAVLRLLGSLFRRGLRLFRLERHILLVGGRGEDHRLFALAAGHADRQGGVLRYRHVAVIVLRLLASQEHRCAPGIGRRGQPRIDAQVGIDAGCRRCGDKGIAQAAAAVGIGEGKRNGKDERRDGAQAETVVLGDIRLRQACIERRDPLRHADLVFLPQGAG